jgi:glycosyltransferase involved in cell wall biosynthesis
VIDGFILTSRYEGFSLAVIEAMAANLPLILSDAPGNRDLFAQPLSHRWAAAPGDSDGFVRAIIEWHDRHQRAEPINHRQIARERFDVRERCAAVLRLYRSLIEKGTADERRVETGELPALPVRTDSPRP